MSGHTGWAQINYKYGDTIRRYDRKARVRPLLHQALLRLLRSLHHVSHRQDNAAVSGSAIRT